MKLYINDEEITKQDAIDRLGITKFNELFKNAKEEYMSDPEKESSYKIDNKDFLVFDFSTLKADPE